MTSKRFVAIFVACCVFFTLSGCGSGQETVPPEPARPEAGSVYANFISNGQEAIRLEAWKTFWEYEYGEYTGDEPWEDFLQNYRILENRTFDVDRDGVDELWFVATDDDYGITFSYLYTLEGDQPKHLRTLYLPGDGSMGGEVFQILYNKDFEEYVVRTQGSESVGGQWGESGWWSSYSDYYRFADGELTRYFGEHMVHMPKDAFSEINFTEDGPYYVDENDSDLITVYYFSDEQVSAAEYDGILDAYEYADPEIYDLSWDFETSG